MRRKGTGAGSKITQRASKTNEAPHIHTTCQVRTRADEAILPRSKGIAFVMILLDPSHDRFHELTAPGSYEWTYFDGLSDDGTLGFVVIWFRGCPMSPYYTAAVDRHTRNPSVPPPDPADFCAVNINVYAHGRRVFSALHEGPSTPFTHDSADACYGTNAVRCGVSRTGHRSYLIALDTRLALDRGGLKGDIEITAPPADAPADAGVVLPDDAAHAWIPAAPSARFTARLDLWHRARSMRKLRFAGFAYHDRNLGRRPLHHLHADWHWGRLHAGRHTFVYFTVVPDGNAAARFGRLLLYEDGRLVAEKRDCTLQEPGRRRHWATLSFPPGISGVGASGDSAPDASALQPGTSELGGAGLSFTAASQRLLDSGPFYHRMLSRIEVLHGPTVINGTGITEFLRPSRLGVAAFRPFVKFRVRRRSSRPDFPG